MIAVSKSRQLFSALLTSFFLVTISLADDIVPQDGQSTMQPTDAAFPIPDQYNLVNDYLGVLQISKAIELTRKLQALEKQNGTQIVFLSVPAVGPEGVRGYATQVGVKWGSGQ